MSGPFSPRGIWAAMTPADRATSLAVLALSGVLALGVRAPDRPARAVVMSGRENSRS